VESKRSFKQRVRWNASTMKKFLKKIEKNPPKQLDKNAPIIAKEVWKDIDCLACANCCKTMSPTFTTKDLKRISAYLNMSVDAFKEKWLFFDKEDKDWMNRKQPCQFLGSDNKCTIYAVRPDDCAGFPHLSKKKMVDYLHVHQQNISYCPATYKMVEKMQEAYA
jgi:uncharacterized protein